MDLVVFEVNFGESQSVMSIEQGRINVRQNATEQGQTDLKSIKVIAGEQVVSSVIYLFLLA